MKNRFSPPVRFIAIILVGWIGFRAIFWMPVEQPEMIATINSEAVVAGLVREETAVLTERDIRLNQRLPAVDRLPLVRNRVATFLRRDTQSSFNASAIRVSGSRPVRTEMREARIAGLTASPERLPVLAERRQDTAPLNVATPTPVLASAPENTASRRRLSVSGWALWRSGGGRNTLANAGQLGGSQAGIRGRYSMLRDGPTDIGISTRISRPIELSSGAEAAIGVSVRPTTAIPAEILIERRIALDSGGREAWSLTVAGGVSRQPLPLGLELDAYGQAGVVGARNRDLFGDAAVTVSHPIRVSERSTLSLGAGTWASAQPGLSRVDVGPEATLRLPVGPVSVRLSAGWRERVAGNAAPDSGPVITLGTDF